MKALRAAALAAVALLAACGGPEGRDADTGYRNPAVTLAGTTRFDAARFAGDWRALACLGPGATRERYALTPDGRLLREADGTVRAFRMTGHGVLRAGEGAEAAQTLVVMWVDDGFRTAVLGDAEGRWAAILNRGAEAPDRTAAAREILDFNGWDLARLRRIEG